MEPPRPRSPAHEQNRRAWDARAAKGARFAAPAADDLLANPRATLDASGWLPRDLTGVPVLCLGAGGGRQSALFAAAGADVTVVDISPAMLALDREVAAERGYRVRIVEASMDDLTGLADASFQVVYQPVSTCYVPDLVAVYREVARVTAAGGLYVSQHKQPASLQADVEPAAGGGYAMREPYYRQGPLPAIEQSLHREAGTFEYLHSWEALVGGLCRSGFVVEDLAEPMLGDAVAERGSFAHRSHYLPPYVRIKARRTGDARRATGLWTP
ncbi:MAG: class I SAM-dependent methyltransferase [Pirellulales bacterium]